MRKFSLKLCLLHLLAFCLIGLGVFKFSEEITAFKLKIYGALNGEAVVAETEYEEESWEAETEAAESTEDILARLAAFADYPAMVHDGGAWYESARLIFHAAGGIDGLSYTNSKEAVELCLEEGNTVIEVDFSFTSDDQLVCVHEWLDIFNTEEPCTLEAFQALKIYGKYTPMTAADVIGYMRQHPQLYIVIDTKEGDSLKVIQRLVDLCEGDSQLIDRFIIQLYRDGEKAGSQEIYPFKDENYLFTLYKFGPQRYDEVMQICYDENIRVITVSNYYAWDAAVLAEFTDKGIVVFEHTVNRVDQAQEAMSRGVHGLYTDFLCEEDLELPAQSGAGA